MERTQIHLKRDRIKMQKMLTLDKTMLNETREQMITEMQIPDTAEERQDKDGEGMDAQQKKPEKRHRISPQKTRPTKS